MNLSAGNKEPHASAAGRSGVARTTSERKLIIGGGMAGLACGCYLQMNGFQTEILEAGAGPGGLCAAWERGPYIFDGCLHWLIGTDSSSVFHQLWKELGAFGQREVWNHRRYMQFEGVGGEMVSLNADLEQLALEFKRIAPEDAARIDQLVAAARRCAWLEPSIDNPLELMTPVQKMRAGLALLPALPAILRWKGRMVGEYVTRFRSPLLRQVLLTLAGDERVSALTLMVLLGWRSRNIIGYVAGGSRALVGAIADRYTSLGGRLHFNTQVTSVTVEAGRATGVRCANGTVLPASTVISCADGRATIFKLLQGRFVNRRILKAYEARDIFPGHIQVSLGIHQCFPGLPPMLSVPLSQPLTVDSQTRHDRLQISFFAANTALCPEGHSVVTVGLTCHSEYWIRLRDEDPVRYQAEKERLQHQVISILDRRFPGLAQHLECSDVATPATFVRYTGNWLGSIQGWLPTPRMIGWKPPRVLPGINDFYMAGQWVQPGGGLPSAALSGRYAAQLICASHGRAFKVDGHSGSAPAPVADAG